MFIVLERDEVEQLIKEKLIADGMKAKLIDTPYFYGKNREKVEIEDVYIEIIEPEAV